MRCGTSQTRTAILDEATANIDTVTEQILENILEQLPESTTKVIIAHRLNTISNADEIFFVNGGTLTFAGSMDHAVELLLHWANAKVKKTLTTCGSDTFRLMRKLYLRA